MTLLFPIENSLPFPNATGKNIWQRELKNIRTFRKNYMVSPISFEMGLFIRGSIAIFKKSQGRIERFERRSAVWN